ncbi:immortalization up-regulated protein [Apteryx rowi]|uniref:immortalization up-regulated protein n=1 Tax=Apteryx rowi TaxID=308060 RepID=UPI000E1CC9C3|nr:immortalization up-regulated protein [Apteryx rowi]
MTLGPHGPGYPPTPGPGDPVSSPQPWGTTDTPWLSPPVSPQDGHSSDSSSSSSSSDGEKHHSPGHEHKKKEKLHKKPKDKKKEKKSH